MLSRFRTQPATPPLSSAVVCSAHDVGTAICRWREKRQEEHSRNLLFRKIHSAFTSSTSENQSQRSESSMLDEIFFVLSTLGHHLLLLGAVSQHFFPQARLAARDALFNSTSSLSSTFTSLSIVLQYSVTSAVAFCAECYPMPIYRGFGDGLLDDCFWGLPDSARKIPAAHAPLMLALDKALSCYKNLGSVRSWNLLTKIPVGIEKYRARYCALSDAEIKPLEEAYKEASSVWEEQGFPQPLDKNISRIVSWRVPFSRFDGKYIHADFKHELHCKYAQDPGRFLFAWTIGKGLEIRAGESLVLCDPVISYLATWLEGLNGVKTKVLSGKEMGWRKMKYSEPTWRVLKTRLENKLSLKAVTEMAFIVNSALSLPPQSIAATTINIGTEPNFDAYEAQPSLYGLDSASASSAPLVVASKDKEEKNGFKPRRAPPPPPAPPAYSRQARAKFPFVAESEEELGFQADDVLEILGEGGDGWMEGSLNGKRGLVPKDYLEEL